MSKPMAIPSEIIPHRDPFLLLDEVTHLDLGIEGKGFWRLTGEEDFFRGHFPGRPTLPGVLMIESIAQLGAYCILSDPKYAGKLVLFGGVDGVRFRRQVLPGDQLDLKISFLKLGARAGKGTGVASVAGETACEAELLFVIVDA